MIQHIIAAIGLFIGIWFTFANVGKVVYKHPISGANLIVMSLGWTIFISAMWIF